MMHRPSDLDSRLDAFDIAWRSGVPPVIEEYLPPPGSPWRMEALMELIRIDLERRARTDEVIRIEPLYLERFPELLLEPSAMLELIQREWCIRQNQLPPPRLDDFLARFPGYQDLLRGMLGPRSLRAEGATVPVSRVGLVGLPAPAPPPIPGYQFGDLLGLGGMGAVYHARDVRLQRDVAIKLILSGNRADESELSRFRREAHVLARLEHPHIVQIHEIGECQGMPYISLELCAGGNLAERLARAILPAGEAAVLLTRLAGAVQAAHDQGIIHRDLKPQNVLFTRDGTARVTDFGLAKRVEDAGETGSVAHVGTPSYMSPEQAAGKNREVGPAADVWGLGAILYECLTGRPPFKADSILATYVQVMKDEPVPPSRLNREVPRDLEAIGLKCLEKDPRRRYGSARDLQDDLERFLAGKPTRARPLGPARRLARWARRQPALASLVLTNLVASLLLAFFAVSEHRARRLAEHKGKQSVESLQVAMEATDDFLGELADNDWLKDAMQAPQRQQMLEKSVALLEKLNEQGHDTPDLAGIQGRAHLRLGLIYKDLGQLDQAREHYQTARDYFDHLLQHAPHDRGYREGLASAHHRLGTIHGDRNQLDQAWDAFSAALELRLELASEPGASPAARLALADTHGALGAVCARRQKTAETHRYYQLALADCAGVVAEVPNHPGARDRLARMHHNLGLHHQEKRNALQAGTHLDASHRLWSQLADEAPLVVSHKRQLARNFVVRGHLLRDQRRPSHAMYRKAIDLLEIEHARQPRLVEVRSDLALACFYLAEQSRSEEREALFHRAWELQSNLIQEFPGNGVYRHYLFETCYQQAVQAVLEMRQDTALPCLLAQAIAKGKEAAGVVSFAQPQPVLRLLHLFAVCRSKTPVDSPQADETIAAALDALNRLHQENRKTFDQMRKTLTEDPTFAPLRALPVFTRWLEQFEPARRA